MRSRLDTHFFILLALAACLCTCLVVRLVSRWLVGSFVHDDLWCALLCTMMSFVFIFAMQNIHGECDQWNSVRLFLEPVNFSDVCMCLNVCLSVCLCVQCACVLYVEVCPSRSALLPPALSSIGYRLLFFAETQSTYRIRSTTFSVSIFCNWCLLAQLVGPRQTHSFACDGGGKYMNIRPKICIAENLFLAYGSKRAKTERAHTHKRDHCKRPSGIGSWLLWARIKCATVHSCLIENMIVINNHTIAMAIPHTPI